MNIVQRTNSEPDCSTLYKPGNTPPAREMRHHRRSVDRIWPPALEVKLAQIMGDDSPSSRPYIIPPAPPVSNKYKLVKEKEREIEYFEQDVKPLQEPLSKMISLFGSRSAPETPIGATKSMPFGISDKKRNSILGPLSPSCNAEMERHISQIDNRPSHIDIKYHRRCKSIPQHQRHYSFAGYGSSYLEERSRNMENNNNNEGFKPFGNTRSHSESPTSLVDSESLFSIGEDPIVEEQEDSDDNIDNDESEIEKTFGNDILAEKKLKNSLSMFRDQVVTSAEANSIRFNLSPVPPPGKNIHPLDFVPDEKSNQDTIPSPQSCKILQNSISPISTSSPTLSKTTRPADPGFEFKPDLKNNNKLQKGEWSINAATTSGTIAASVNQNDGENFVEREPSTESDFSTTFLDVISNDQDRWRSPTLSALASLSTSPRPGHDQISQIGGNNNFVNNEWIAGRGTGVNMNTFLNLSETRGYGWNSPLQSQRIRRNISQEADLTAAIPLLEAYDEISLQDIWRMEEEERRDRYDMSDGDVAKYRSMQVHIASMKGEKHALEEAKIIQDVLRGISAR